MTQRARAATGLTICCFAWGNDSEIQIKSFNEFKRQKELGGSVVGRWAVFEHEEDSPQIKGGRRRRDRKFGCGQVRNVQGWSLQTTDEKLKQRRLCVHIESSQKSKYL